ncbi:ribonuclease P protein subunit p29 [Anopheles ziemanni]|uniref:ribonuclease P protein subunit p29 n=1 Tax=Anopheles coustani TaxID=139045 RepID=UPI0026593029|nr:ribonuclease P protein subunit p29 [Anopheles coustani]XP_058170562.1 ribonuclease P protein subunit p29 [Anopheles ziemanni]
MDDETFIASLVGDKNDQHKPHVLDLLFSKRPFGKDPAKRKKTRKHQEKSVLSRQQIKDLGLYALPHGTITYNDAVPLHKMWCEYISTCFHRLEIPSVTEPRYNNTVASLLKADYHGAKVTIVRSKQSSVIGVKGIVILETKGTFKIVSKDNKIRTIPKNDSLFEVHIRDIVVTISGNILNARPAERSVRKLKNFSFSDV